VLSEKWGYFLDLEFLENGVDFSVGIEKSFRNCHPKYIPFQLSKPILP